VAQEHRELSTAGVWWLPYGMALAGSCEAIAEEADKLLAISTTADHVLPTNAGHQVPSWGPTEACRHCCIPSANDSWYTWCGLGQQL
jgi:hypothetical protein